MAKPVLVTSAAGGRQGKTGRHVSKMLLKRGIPVRAFVHKMPVLLLHPPHGSIRFDVFRLEARALCKA